MTAAAPSPQPQHDAILRVEGLTKAYYGLTAVDHVSFSVARGSITSMIGPNGSGKSTTIDCVSGFQRANGGRWQLDDRELTGLKAHEHALAGLTRTFQTVRAYDELSLLDNLRIAAQEHDGAGWLDAIRSGLRLRQAERAATARAHELLDLVGLADYSEAPAEILSYGQRKLLAIAGALMSRPKIIMLDEPVAGVNPTMIRKVEDVIRRINGEGVTLLIVEHNVDFVMALSDQVFVLESGRLLAQGDPAAVREDPRVLDAYLGAPVAADGGSGDG